MTAKNSRKARKICKTGAFLTQHLSRRTINFENADGERLSRSVKVESNACEAIENAVIGTPDFIFAETAEWLQIMSI